MINPKDEGITHLNVYSKSTSPLGRLLTNFARATINTPDGKFNSVEGYWYWLSIPDGTPGKDQLRRLYGYAAKKRGRELRACCAKTRFEPEFEQKIRLAVRSKLTSANPRIINLPEGNLPLTHYYITRNNRVYDVSHKFGWLMNVWREELDAARNQL